MRSPLLRSLALAVLSGVLYFVGFVGFDQWYLAWICLVPLLLALRDLRTWRGALGVSWAMGFVTHLGGYHWVVHLLETFAHLSTPLAVLGYLLLCGFQSGVLAATGVLAWTLHRRANVPLGLALPPALLAAELVYPLIFPSYLANSQAWVPAITQIADLGGVLIVSGLIALVNGALYELLAAALDRRRLPWKLPAAAAAAVVASLGYGVLRTDAIEERDAAAPKLKVAIVQANVGAADKHERAREGIERYRRMTDEAMAIPGIGLVVWPESGLNRTIGEKTRNLARAVSSGPLTAPMIVGALRSDREGPQRRIWNTAFSIDAEGAITGHYDKVERLVFGEYIPGDTIWPGIYDLFPYSGHFDKGESLEPLPVGPYRMATHICYEDILPGLVRQLMTPWTSSRELPHALVNVTNDSWYGPAEPPIHLALATFRTIEHRRWMIRSTATGISAFVDASGRVVAQSGFETAETLVHDVPMVTAGPTVYGRIGDVAGWLALGGCVFLLARRRKARGALPDERAAA